MNKTHKKSLGNTIISQSSSKSKRALSSWIGNLPRTYKAFTIVELLIVVVVIAILAAITIVAYNGITNQAKETTLKSDLKTAATELELSRIDSNSYPENPTLKKSGDNNLNYSGGGNTFCITATNPTLPTKTFHTTQDGGIKDGPCSGHPATVAGSMQSFTTAQCNALPVYTGSNESAVIGLTDNRGGTTRTYQVAKLADNKCWMLNNLKLGSTTGTITLTPTDSNVASNFTLPQLVTTRTIDTSTNPGNDYDTPYTYGPVPGDTGSGTTNYGYLYNFSAATAGATRTSLPAGNGTAPNSICPANWRLPSGASETDANELLYLAARMAGYTGVADAISHASDAGFMETFSAPWQNNGPFKGVISGGWWGSFNGQASSAYLWSRSAHATSANNAHRAYFDAGVVGPVSNGNRYLGLGVRCLLN